MNLREQCINEIERVIGKRKLIWFGTRGTDARPLLSVEQFSAVFSQIAPLSAISIEQELCLESMTKTRVNLDTYDLDKDSSQAVRDLISGFVRSVSEPCIVMTYRPHHLTSSLFYPRQRVLTQCTMSANDQRRFEFKPWVETELKKNGIPIIPWEYYGADELPRLRSIFNNNPDGMVLRAAVSDGGEGVALVIDPKNLESKWPERDEAFVAASPYFKDSVSMNINAVLYKNGEMSIHAPSLQLLGLPECTDLPFGYCGNDFYIMDKVSPNALNQTTEHLRNIGKWLHFQGYIGAFGIDTVISDDKVYIAEINPRFQGSSEIGSRIDLELDRPDMYLAHLCAFLDIPIRCTLDISSLAAMHPKLSHKIYHNIKKTSPPNESVSKNTIDYRFDVELPDDIHPQSNCIIHKKLFD